MKLFLPSLFLLLSVSAFSQKQYMLVGTYTSTTSKGIYVYQFDSKNGTAQLVDSIITSNPSYLAVAPNQAVVYAVNENENKGNGGSVTAFSFDKESGHLSLINQQPSKGDAPCYVAVDKTGKWVIAGNYTSGNLSVLPIKKDGSLGEVVDTEQDKGSGINKNRQEGPHVHSTVFSPDNKYVFTPDLGIDKVMIYSFNSKTGQLKPSEQPYVKVKDGSGPRHFIFHPNGKWAYVSQELSGSASAFSYANGKLKLMQTISSLPHDYKGSLTTADIHISPNGKFLYVSNRDESNTIAIFSINQQTGKLKTI
ncbi:MAG TPA: lactonase family protein, partial [Flavisolibacter sp.]|nr:lactonase family protein [Flavisolibacter sp.]